MKKWYVYAIGDKKDLIEPYDQCYIGVTIDLQRRWKNHLRSPYTVGQHIREEKWSFQNNMVQIFSGTKDECFTLEAKYRPYPLIGLNEASGGCGGNRAWTEERNAKISKALRGRKCTWGSKISQSKKESGIAKGAKNSRAKTWKLTDPMGNEYIVHGELSQFCVNHSISFRTIYRFRNQIVPPTHIVKPKDKELRDNTTGWRLQEYVSL